MADDNPYTEFARAVIEQISTVQEPFSRYSEWHALGIKSVTLATPLRLDDLGYIAIKLSEATDEMFATTSELIAKAEQKIEQGDPIELGVAVMIVHKRAEKSSSWLAELEAYKRALFTIIDSLRMYSAIPCAQHSVVCVMMALEAMVLSKAMVRITPCGATHADLERPFG